MIDECFGSHDQRAASFGTAADDYERYRPGYPDEVVDWMLPPNAQTGGPPRVVLDLGAGTGKLTRPLVERGLEVWAVEPDPGMLAVLVQQLPTVHALRGRAEATGLATDSVDAVVIGQAWHWMHPATASAELARVLRPGGSLAMCWNSEEHEATPWLDEFEKYATSPRGRSGGHGEPTSPFVATEKVLHRWERSVSVEHYLGEQRSRSAWLTSSPHRQREAMDHWRGVLQNHPATAGRDDLAIPYLTEAWRTHR